MSIRRLVPRWFQVGSWASFAFAAGCGSSDLSTAPRGSTAGSQGVPTASAAEDSLLVTPADTAVAAGVRVTLRVSDRTRRGATVDGPVQWTASGGTVSSDGQFVAMQPGTYTLTAQRGGKKGRVRVEVGQPAVMRVDVTPSAANVTTGAGLAFSATAVLSDSTRVAADVRWSSTGGTIDSLGQFRSTVTGVFSVVAVAKQNGVADTATIEVIPPPRIVQSIEVNPGVDTAFLGRTVAFTATARLSDGTTVTPAVSWTATGGSISAAGLFTAGSLTGAYRIIVRDTVSGLADTAQVVVLAPIVTRIILSPDSAVVAAGASQPFSVTAQMSDGSTTTPTVVYSATGGTISSAGIYSAGSVPGTFRVIARLSGGTVADTSVVRIPNSITRCSVSPDTARLMPGGTQQFAATAYRLDGSATTAQFTWTASGGQVSSTGLFTAGTMLGRFAVVAAVAATSVSCGSGVEVSNVTNPVATIQSVRVTPGDTTVRTGSTIQFQGRAITSAGDTLAASLRWTSNLGTITRAGLLSVGTATGTARVVGTDSASGRSDTTLVTVVAAPAPGTNNMYFNSAEPGCDGTDPNVLMCDDFEDGDWYTKNCDQARASGGLLQTDGWCGTIFNDAGMAAGTARCGGRGVRSDCAATTGVFTSENANMADHALSGAQGVNEIWVRFYTKPLGGYAFGAEKMLTFNDGQPGGAGIRWGNLSWNCGAGSAATTGTLTMGFPAPMDVCQLVNTGNSISIQSGNWYFYEVHYRLSTPGQSDGIFELWVDNCGPTGTACPATPTLRIRRTDVRNARTSTNELIRVLWFEAWANPRSGGERYWDQIKVARVGPIGYMR